VEVLLLAHPEAARGGVALLSYETPVECATIACRRASMCNTLCVWPWRWTARWPIPGTRPSDAAGGVQTWAHSFMCGFWLSTSTWVLSGEDTRVPLWPVVNGKEGERRLCGRSGGWLALVRWVCSLCWWQVYAVQRFQLLRCKSDMWERACFVCLWSSCRLWVWSSARHQDRAWSGTPDVVVFGNVLLLTVRDGL